MTVTVRLRMIEIGLQEALTIARVSARDCID
jgi:hypothetical protein